MIRNSIICSALFLALSATLTQSNVVNAQALECNSVTVNWSWFHTTRFTACEDGSGTAFHQYPGGLYCVHTFDGNGGEFSNCGVIEDLDM